MMTQTEIKKLRAYLTLKNQSTAIIAEKFGVTGGAVDQVITGETTSKRIQDHIAKVIGFWPKGWKKRNQRRPK